MFAEPSEKDETSIKISYGDVSKTSCIPKTVVAAFDGGDPAAVADEIMQKAYGAAKPKNGS